MNCRSILALLAISFGLQMSAEAASGFFPNKVSVREQKQKLAKARPQVYQPKKFAPKASNAGGDSSCCCDFTAITPDDLATTYFITSPGKYILQDDVAFMPTGSGAAIVILSDNVLLDLCGHTLSEGDDKATDGVIGIQIGNGYNVELGTITNAVGNGITVTYTYVSEAAPITVGQVVTIAGNDPSQYDAYDAVVTTASATQFSIASTATGAFNSGGAVFAFNPNDVYQNVTIQNGTVRDFSEIGVFSYNASFDYPTLFSVPTDEVPFQDLHFYDLNVLNCGPVDVESFDDASGIDLDYSYNVFPLLFTPDVPVAFVDVIIDDCNVNECIGHGAVNVASFDNLIIRDTQANNLSITINTFGFCFAYDLLGRNLQMTNCQGNGLSNFSDIPTSPTYASQSGGISIEDSLNIYVKDCQFNDAFGNNDYIVNSNLGLNANAVYENCQFNNNRGGDLATAVFAVHYSEATPENIHTEATQFINCQFNGTSVSDDAEGYGSFSITAGLWGHGSTNTIVESCQACNIQPSNPGYSAFGFAIGLEPHGDLLSAGGTRNIVLRNCVTSDISTAGACAAGIFLNSTNLSLVGSQFTDSNYLVEDCDVMRIWANAPTSSGLNHLVAGITETIYNFTHDPLLENYGTEFMITKNVIVKNCIVSEVHNYDPESGAIQPIRQSAGILIGETQNPVIEGNIVTDCDRGILLAGTNVAWPNGFQLAATYADATATPPVFIDLTSVPGPTPAQTFKNVTRDNKVKINPVEVTGTIPGPGSPNYLNLPNGTVDTTYMFILPNNADITKLGWQPGDKIVYNANGGSNIDNLVSGATYYAIVYIPGYSEHGLIKNNDVTNCALAGYQDDKPHCTSSAWLSNIAFCNGPEGKENYKIRWSGKAPVATGSLSDYPKPKSYIENVGISCNKCDCSKKKHKR